MGSPKGTPVEVELREDAPIYSKFHNDSPEPMRNLPVDLVDRQAHKGIQHFAQQFFHAKGVYPLSI